jgi:hypothetical protein
LIMAQTYLAALQNCGHFSADFAVCIDALQAHIDNASQQVARLA